MNFSSPIHLKLNHDILYSMNSSIIEQKSARDAIVSQRRFGTEGFQYVDAEEVKNVLERQLIMFRETLNYIVAAHNMEYDFRVGLPEIVYTRQIISRNRYMNHVRFGDEGFDFDERVGVCDLYRVENFGITKRGEEYTRTV